MKSDPNEACLLWSGEHECWWRTGGVGYTVRDLKAGVFTREEAEGIAGACGDEKRLRVVPLSELLFPAETRDWAGTVAEYLAQRQATATEAAVVAQGGAKGHARRTDPDTSHEAAVELTAERLGALRLAVLRALRDATPANWLWRPGLEILRQGAGCPAYGGGAHIHTSVADAGREFYPCLCGERFALSPVGLTTQQIAEAAGLPWNTVTPRMRPLERAGAVRRTGEKRQQATGGKAQVWALTDAGRSLLWAAEAVGNNCNALP